MLNFVAWGTEQWANNASVAPTMPPGIVAGDHLFLFAYIRENLASANTPAGWAPVMNFAGFNTENTVQVFYRRHLAGDAAPVVTFTGGGSGDATCALIGALRSTTGAAVVAGPVPGNFGETTTTFTSVTLQNSITSSNSVVGLLAGFQNDAPTATSTLNWINNGPIANRFSEQKLTSTILGSDASISVGFAAPNFNPPANDAGRYLYYQNNWDGTTNTGAAWILFAVIESLDATYASEGGASAGGSATTAYYPPGQYEYTAEGGLSAGSAISISNFSEQGLRQVQAEVTGFRKDSIGSVTLNWTTSGLDDNTLLLLCVASDQSGVSAAGVAVPVCPSGWNEITGITSNSYSKLRVFWRRWSTGSPTTVTVTFSGDTLANISKAAVLNFFKNVDWNYSGGNPFDAPFNQVAGTLLTSTPFYYTPTGSTSSTQLTIKASGTSISYGGGPNWKVLGGVYAGGGGQTSCAVRMAFRYSAGTRSSNTQETSGYAFTSQFTTTYHHAHVSVATLGGATVYGFTPSGGATLGGTAPSIPPATAAVFVWSPSGGVKPGGSAYVTTTPGPAARRLSGLSLAWPAAARILASIGERLLVETDSGETLRLSEVSIRRDLYAGNTIELAAHSSAAPVSTSEVLTIRLVKLDGSGSIVSERVWSATVKTVKHRDAATGAWRVICVESGVRAGGVTWSPSRVSLRRTGGIRAAPDLLVVAGDLYAGRILTRVTTFLRAEGAGATEASYG